MRSSPVWRQPKRSQAGGWVKEMGSLHTMECYSAIKKKRNEILQYATTGMNLKAPVPSEVSQAQKGKYRWLHFYGVHTTGKFKKAKSRMVGAGVQEERGGKLLSMVTKFQR